MNAQIYLYAEQKVVLVLNVVIGGVVVKLE
jgi:hypothetical protein